MAGGQILYISSRCSLVDSNLQLFTIFTYRRRGRGVRLKAGSSKGGVGLVAKSGGRGLPPPPLPVPCLSGYRPLPDSIQRPMGLDGRGRSGGRELFTSSWPGWNLSDYILQPRSRLLSEARANQEIIKKKKKEGESNRRQLFSSFFSFFFSVEQSRAFLSELKELTKSRKSEESCDEVKS